MWIEVMNGLWNNDTDRVVEIGKWLPVGSNFIIGISDGVSRIWHPIKYRDASECSWQSDSDCTGCNRLAMLTSGRIALLYEPSKWSFDIRKPLGAICTTVNNWYQPVYFK